jgi:DNA-binding XRE family transcriptional regulator
MNSIAEFRKKGDITQKILAKELGWDGQRISHIETGRKKKVLLDEARAIELAFISLGVNCLLDDIFPPHAANDESTPLDAA